MIKNWKKFNESSDLISYETLSEIIMFRNNSLLSSHQNLHRSIDIFIEKDLDEDCDDLTPLTTQEWRNFREKIERLVAIIKNNPELSNTLISLYKEVEEQMKGFPKFYELEDLFLDIMDDGWQINFLVKVNDSLEIEVSNEMSELIINYDDFVNLQIECNGKLKRMKSLFPNECEIVYLDYSKQGQKNVGQIKFQLSVKS